MIEITVVSYDVTVIVSGNNCIKFDPNIHSLQITTVTVCVLVCRLTTRWYN